MACRLTSKLDFYFSGIIILSFYLRERFYTNLFLLFLSVAKQTILISSGMLLCDSFA